MDDEEKHLKDKLF